MPTHTPTVTDAQRVAAAEFAAELLDSVMNPLEQQIAATTSLMGRTGADLDWVALLRQLLNARDLASMLHRNLLQIADPTSSPSRRTLRALNEAF
jgi:hypothetical protein